MVFAAQSVHSITLHLANKQEVPLERWIFKVSRSQIPQSPGFPKVKKTSERISF